MPNSLTTGCHNLAEYLQKISTRIGKETLARISQEDYPQQYLYDLMRDYPQRGGKRFRSALVLLSCELFGGDPEQAMASAVALELFHNFALVHDDIEDSSLMRRGLPTLHMQHGIPLAINVGDSLSGLVYEVLLENQVQFSAAKTLELLQHFNLVFRKTFEGQALDIGWVAQNHLPSRSEYFAMIRRKTSMYSGQGPCQGGALVASASAKHVQLIGEFGEALGIGFQIRDDVLNLTSQSAEIAPQLGGYGKERGGDIVEGKRTLIIIELLKVLPIAEQQRVKEILCKPAQETSAEEVDWCIQRAEQIGVFNTVMSTCHQYVDLAREKIQQLPTNQARTFLEEVIEFLILQRQA